MTEGIRATVIFTGDDICSITELSSKASNKIRSISSSVCTDGCSSCVTDYLLHAEEPPDSELEPVYSDGSTHRYRLKREGEPDCPCELLGSHGCSVDRYVAEDGELTITFFSTGFDQLREVIEDLRDSYPDVDVKRLIRSPDGHGDSDVVYVDRGKLTARQQEVLETAYRMGYFERPRGANATEVAEELEIDPSTASEHLAAAQNKLLDDLLLD